MPSLCPERFRCQLQSRKIAGLHTFPGDLLGTIWFTDGDHRVCDDDYVFLFLGRVRGRLPEVGGVAGRADVIKDDRKKDQTVEETEDHRCEENLARRFQ